MQIVSVPGHAKLAKHWENINPHVKKIQPHLNGVIGAINGSGVNKSSISPAESSAPAQNFVDNCLDALKSIAAEFLQGIEFLLKHISKYGNATISIPVISGLYKSLVGHDLTVFDAISLIIGIVANTVTTIITGSPPPIIAGPTKSDKKPNNASQYESGMPASTKSDVLANLLELDGSSKFDPNVISSKR